MCVYISVYICIYVFLALGSGSIRFSFGFLLQMLTATAKSARYI